MVYDVSNTRVALLTSSIPPYHLSLWETLAARVGHLRVFLSRPQTANPNWGTDRGSLDVCLQRNLNLPFRGGYNELPSSGFTKNNLVGIPYDTFRRLNEFRPNVVISLALGGRTVLATLWCKWHRDTRLIVDLHLTERTEISRGRLRNFVREWLLPRADAILVNGASSDRYVRKFNVQEERIFHFTPVTDPSSFMKIPLARSKHPARQLLIVGQLINRKGLIPFMTVLARWAADHPGEMVDLCIVGIGPLRDEILALEVPENLRVNMVGYVQYNDLPKFYANAEIFAFPTLADEWGMVVNEALAAGLPVLGSVYSQAVVELVQNNAIGWCFTSDDPEGVYKEIDLALTTPVEQINRMRKKCRNLGSKLTPASGVDEMLKAIRYVLGDTI